MKLEDLPIEEQQLIERHNAASRINTFFYNDEKAHDLIKELYPRFDRMNIIQIKHEIGRQLTPIFHERYHGKKCKIRNLEGTIKHDLTYEFTNYSGVKETTEHNVAFRSTNHDDSYADQVPAFWVEVLNEDGTVNNWNTHLYYITEIELI